MNNFFATRWHKMEKVVLPLSYKPTTKPQNMTILIAKQNEQLIQTMFSLKKLKFEEATKNTSTFKVSKNVFNKLYNVVRENGYNPYCLMNW